jgi:hypothetical protein
VRVPFVLLLATFLVAGCSQATPPHQTTTSTASSTEGTVLVAQDGSSAVTTMRPPPIYLNGTMTAAGACGQPLPSSLGPSETVSVPPAAQGRSFKGPMVSTAIVNAGPLCASWIDAGGAALNVTDGRVPKAAASLVVRSSAHVQADWTVRVE